jgi:hypothetical protein
VYSSQLKQEEARLAPPDFEAKQASSVKELLWKTKQKPNMHFRGVGMLCIEDGQIFL